jgi:hypothetical protein
VDPPLLATTLVAVKTRAVRDISRKGPIPRDRESSETARQARLARAVMIQSGLHGDMQSSAEMTEPPTATSGVTFTNGPKVAKFLVG